MRRLGDHCRERITHLAPKAGDLASLRGGAIRARMPLPFGGTSALTARWMPSAHLTASTTLENSTRVPSPISFTTRPLCPAALDATLNA